jgi:hypothetical protein
MSVLETWIARWLICSQWAGRWASSSKVLPEYAKQLSQACIQLAATTSMAAALAIIEDRISSLVADTVSDALAYAKTFSVSQREHVSRYNRILWIWHRLDADRWEMSSIRRTTPIPPRTRRPVAYRACCTLALPSALAAPAARSPGANRAIAATSSAYRDIQPAPASIATTSGAISAGVSAARVAAQAARPRGLPIVDNRGGQLGPSAITTTAAAISAHRRSRCVTAIQPPRSPRPERGTRPSEAGTPPPQG